MDKLEITPDTHEALRLITSAIREVLANPKDILIVWYHVCGYNQQDIAKLTGLTQAAIAYKELELVKQSPILGAILGTCWTDDKTATTIHRVSGQVPLKG